MQRHWIKLSGLLLLALVTACAKPTTQRPVIDRAAVSQETAYQKSQLQQVGRDIRKTPYTKQEIAVMQQRLAQHGERVRQAGMRMCEYMGKKPGSCQFTFKLEPKEELNAYANGKEIVVTPAMMRFAQSDDWLGIVLSHEYAHNIMGHVNAKMQNATAGMLAGTLADILAQSQGLNTGGQLSNLGAQTASEAFSPEFEEEADYVGMYIMAIAGYDITQASALWRAMTTADPRGAFLRGSHPANPERYVLIESTKNEIIQKVKNKQILVPNIRPKA
ncbi:MAG: M48 family metallopeptidase [Rickettsiales bacterium]